MIISSILQYAAKHCDYYDAFLQWKGFPWVRLLRRNLSKMKRSSSPLTNSRTIGDFISRDQQIGTRGKWCLPDLSNYNWGWYIIRDPKLKNWICPVAAPKSVVKWRRRRVTNKKQFCCPVPEISYTPEKKKKKEGHKAPLVLGARTIRWNQTCNIRRNLEFYQQRRPKHSTKVFGFVHFERAIWSLMFDH